MPRLRANSYDPAWWEVIAGVVVVGVFDLGSVASVALSCSAENQTPELRALCGEDTWAWFPLAGAAIALVGGIVARLLRRSWLLVAALTTGVIGGVVYWVARLSLS